MNGWSPPQKQKSVKRCSAVRRWLPSFFLWCFSRRVLRLRLRRPHRSCSQPRRQWLRRRLRFRPPGGKRLRLTTRPAVAGLRRERALGVGTRGASVQFARPTWRSLADHPNVISNDWDPETRFPSPLPKAGSMGRLQSSNANIPSVLHGRVARVRPDAWLDKRPPRIAAAKFE